MFKNENGFSLVELAVAAGIAVALGAVILGTAGSVSASIEANSDAAVLNADSSLDNAETAGDSVTFTN